MDQASREWFDAAYSFSRGMLPFSFLTFHMSIEDLCIFWPKGLTLEDAQKISKELNHFVDNLPSEKYFLEEKRRVKKELMSILREALPNVHTAICFGTLRDDLDIALISNKKVSKNIIIKLARQYAPLFPIVDWQGMMFFQVANGTAFVDKLIESRHLAIPNCPNKLSRKELKYMSQVVLGAELFWGNRLVINEMRCYIETPAFLDNFVK